MHIPAASWTAAGGRGAPVVASEAAVLSTLPGNVVEQNHGDDEGRLKENKQTETREPQRRREWQKQGKS